MDIEYLLQLRTKTGKNPKCSAHYERGLDGRYDLSWSMILWMVSTPKIDTPLCFFCSVFLVVFQWRTLETVLLAYALGLERC